MNPEMTDCIKHDDLSHVESVLIRYNTTLKMLIQANGGTIDPTKAQSESDVIEALDIVEQITHDRLSTTPNEWKGDEKQEFQALFNSIESEIKEAIHINFSSPTSQGIGFTLSKFQQLVVESFISILRKLGPENAKQFSSQLISEGKQSIFSLKQNFHRDDADVARHIIKHYTRQRNGGANKTLTKEQRYALIARVVERMELTEDE